MATLDADPGRTTAPSHARVVVRVLGAVFAALVVYGCWRGYHSPDFLLGFGAAFGLC